MDCGGLLDHSGLATAHFFFCFFVEGGGGVGVAEHEGVDLSAVEY